MPRHSRRARLTKNIVERVVQTHMHPNLQTQYIGYTAADPGGLPFGCYAENVFFILTRGKEV